MYFSLLKVVVSLLQDEQIYTSSPSLIYIIPVLGTEGHAHIEMNPLVLHILDSRNIPGKPFLHQTAI